MASQGASSSTIQERIAKRKRHPSEDHLRKLSDEIDEEFESLAKNLGFKRADLDYLRQNHNTDRIFNMLVNWKRRNYHIVDLFQVLIEALKSVKRDDLACKVDNWREMHHKSRAILSDRAPAEILARPEALQAYREAIKSGKKAVYRTRVMFVGQERVGKTSLRKRLMEKKFDDNEISTDGIEASADCRIDVHQTTSWTVHQDTKDQYTDAIAENMARQLKEKPNNSQSEQQPDENRQTPTRRGPTDSNQRTSDNTEEQSREEEQVNINEDEVDADREVPVLHVPDRLSKILTEKMLDEVFLEDNNAREITFSLWDFAGQELYYTTHQVFLTWRTIYVVVVNLLDDFSQTTTDQTVPPALRCLDFWLQSIKTFCDLTKAEQSDECFQLSPPIFIVGTHRNGLGATEEEHQQQVDNKFESIRQSFKGKPYREHIVNEYFDVENSLEGDETISKLKISKLKEKMKEVMKKEPYMGEEIPLRWLQFEDSVKEEAAKRDNYHMCVDIEEVKQFSGAREIPVESSNKEFTTMLQFYHDLGTIMYYPDAKSTLQKKVILKPHWLIDVFRRVITVPAKKKAKNLESWERLGNEGILEDKLINLMWKDFIGNDGQSKEKKSALLELMKTYDLLVEKQCHPDQQQPETERLYYVPSRLSKEMDAEGDNGGVDSHSTVFYVDFNGFLPVGFFHRTMVRAVDWSQKQDGVEFEPKLLYRKATFYADKFYSFQLEMMPNQPSLNKVLLSLIKVVISPEKVVGDSTASRDDVDPAVFHKVKEFLSNTFKDLKSMWARGIEYKFCLACPCCCTFCEEKCRCVCNCCSSDAFHLLDLDKCLNCTKPSGNSESEILQCTTTGKPISMKRFSERYSDVKQEEAEKKGEKKKKGFFSKLTQSLPESLLHPSRMFKKRKVVDIKFNLDLKHPEVKFRTSEFTMRLSNTNQSRSNQTCTIRHSESDEIRDTIEWIWKDADAFHMDGQLTIGLPEIVGGKLKAGKRRTKYTGKNRMSEKSNINNFACETPVLAKPKTKALAEVKITKHEIQAPCTATFDDDSEEPGLFKSVCHYAQGDVVYKDEDLK